MRLERNGRVDGRTRWWVTVVFPPLRYGMQQMSRLRPHVVLMHSGREGSAKRGTDPVRQRDKAVPS